jgi:hypothetical protein
MIRWSDISPEDFEGLCFELMELNGFKNIKWYGKGGGDKGRDLTAEKFEEPISGIQKLRKWVVQCKRYTTSNLSKADIQEFLAAAREHEPDSVLLVITNTLTTNVRDWLTSINKDYSFDIFLWEERDLQREVANNRSKIQTKIKILPASGEATLFYDVASSGKKYMCDIPELIEMGFYIMNDYGHKQNAEYLQEFIDYIRNNEITFQIEDDD